jgi:N-methylhydantoinase A
MVSMAIEVGGTFTDLIWLDGDGLVRTHKLPSTPADPSQGVIAGLEQALGDRLGQVETLFHGSTVATNAVLERKGCRAALLTTEGFRDLLELQRQLRPNVYSLACLKPRPLIPLERVGEVRERLDAGGRALRPLDEAALLATLDRLMAEQRPQAIAVCLLHAYANPAHEERVGQLVRERHPDLPVVLSSAVLPTFREYERASTTAMAAYLAPLVGRYLQSIEKHLAGQGGGRLFVMQSSGGVLPAAGLGERGVEMLNSGPAAGVIAATRVAARIGDSDILTLDVGGTSADVCLVSGGVPAVRAETEVDGLPVGMPTVDIANVGAGGGSIGWIDRGGMLQLGPQSAGARPGPACYGHGGGEPTTTDALVELGWIRPERFLGGRMTLQPAAARAALLRLGTALGRTAAETAEALLAIGVANVGRGVRLVSVQRGHDPQGHALYGYGGMGPMIAALAAEELRIGRVVIPPHPGLFSALGLLLADLRRIYRETAFLALDAAAPARIAATFERLAAAATAEFAGYGVGAERLAFEHLLEMRYAGQGFELLVPFEPGRLAAEGEGYLRGLFRAVHETRYGGKRPGAAAAQGDGGGGGVEIVTFRLVAQAPRSQGLLDRLGGAGGGAPVIEAGSIRFRGAEIPCRFAWRESLPEGLTLEGCAIVEEPTATTLVPPGWCLRVGKLGALEIERRT